MPKPTKKTLDGDQILFDGGFMSSKPFSWREPRICVVCGKEYEPNNSKQKCCSKECSEIRRVEYKALKNKEYWAAHKDRINRERAEKGDDHEVRPPRGASHNITPTERIEMNRVKAARQRNMEELKRIALESNGDYGKWVAIHDR